MFTGVITCPWSRVNGQTNGSLICWYMPSNKIHAGIAVKFRIGHDVLWILFCGESDEKLHQPLLFQDDGYGVGYNDCSTNCSSL